MPDIAAEYCMRCLGGVLQAGNVKDKDDLCPAFSASTALEILLRRVCTRGGDVHVGGACVNLGLLYRTESSAQQTPPPSRSH